MKGHLALPSFAALALAACFVSLPLRAAENPPKPGTITSVAGTGEPGFSGDNGPANVAVDSAGTLFVADFNNYRVRKVSPEGMITTVAGSGKNQPYAGDGGLATDTGLRGAAGLAIDAGGNLLIADSPYPRVAPYNERVVKVFGVAAPGLIAGKAFPQ